MTTTGPSDPLRAPVARFDDIPGGTSLQFSRIERIVTATTAEQVRPALAAVEEAVAGGQWAAGMIAYEAAPGLDPAAVVRDSMPGLPLVWFAIADAPDGDPEPLTCGDGYRVDPWQLDVTPAEYARKVERVHRAIAAGDTYQVNLTARLHSRIEGDLLGLYGDLAHRQRGRHHAYLDLGTHTVLSASPESFVTWEGEQLVTRPMKGTIARGRTPEIDRAARVTLLASEKDRAENVMIVDLLRNDLARAAQVGSVQVEELLACEEYPTLWQLTSAVTARATEGLGLTGLMEALFPCGSITGAPKLSTMALIAELEDSPRGVYCGAIGWLAPGERPRARFSVAIRTILVDRADGSAIYGAGGGVTWQSTAAGEHDELLVKARVLPEGEREPFALIETFAAVDGRAQNLGEHLDRLAASAAELGMPLHRDCAEAMAVDAAARSHDPRLVRLRLDRDGTLSVHERALPEPGPGPVRLALDSVPTAVDPVLARHKTTMREHFTRARERFPHADDVVLVDADGRVLETTIATIAARIDGTWCTPPLEVECLPGVGRALAIGRGELIERVLTTEDLRRAEELAVISSARGWRPAVLIDPQV